ncbi:MAG: 2OG-Fe(II) oxygenase, partial [Planctomycetes bacterium]|nr:2OG-Fe(II) oxygenase [Planctomycetota bacterium]
YKLLIYEKGSFFLPHRDGEQRDGMVASLVVALPSPHSGGELVIRHEGQEHEIEFVGAAAGRKISFAAFYADCEHDVRPLKSGFRIALVYNLCLARSRRKKTIAPPSFATAMGKMVDLLSEIWDATGLRKIAVTLDHLYTEGGLDLDLLKGADRARAELMFAVAERCGHHVYLGLVTLYQMGEARVDDYHYGRRRYRRYDEPGPADCEMGELYENDLSVDHWSDHQGRRANLGQIDFEPEEIIASEPLSSGEPSEQEFEGYTGNAGMTLERWYRRAAVVIWPEDAHFELLCGAGTVASVGGLEAMVARLGKTTKAKREASRRDCLSFAQAICHSWDPSRDVRIHAELELARASFLQSLESLDDADVTRLLLETVMPKDGAVAPKASFTKLLKGHGWEAVEASLRELMTKSNRETVVRNAELIARIAALRDKDESRLRVGRNLCIAITEAVMDIDEESPPHYWRGETSARKNLLGSLIAAMIQLDAAEPLARLIQHIQRHPQLYSLTDVQVPALLNRRSRSSESSPSGALIDKWIAACRSTLEERTKTEPSQPLDYRRDATLTCRCVDCSELAKFLANPQIEEVRFPMAERRRSHVEGTIARSRSDCNTSVLKKGSPYSLVCTKNIASYERQRATYRSESELLQKLRVRGPRVFLPY